MYIVENYEENTVKKKKKPAFGFFATLNPDAGDVEKTIDMFNDYVSDDIGTNVCNNQSMMEELLTEGKVVTFDGKTNPSDGWIVVMAGGSGSGKGFVFDTLVPFHGKKLDPDELKPYVIKTSEIIGDKIVFKDGSEINLEDAGIYPPYDMSNPDFVSLIHTHPLTKRLKKQQKDTLYRAASTSDASRRPNIIFDTTLDELSKIEAIVDTYKPLGYKIAVVYVFTPIDTAVNQNASRARKVPKEVLLEIHRGVYKTLPKLLANTKLVSQINEIWVVQQYHVNSKDKQSLADYIKKNNVTKLPKNSEGLKYLESEMIEFVEKQLSRIAELEKEMHDDNLKAKSFEDSPVGSNVVGGNMAENLILENDDYEEEYQSWTDVYENVFEDIVHNFFPDVQVIEKKVEEIYRKHEGEEAWDTAWEKWIEWVDEDKQEFDEELDDDVLYIIRDKQGNQLSDPNPNENELWDEVDEMEASGKRGLMVVTYTGK